MISYKSNFEYTSWEWNYDCKFKFHIHLQFLFSVWFQIPNILLLLLQQILPVAFILLHHLNLSYCYWLFLMAEMYIIILFSSIHITSYHIHFRFHYHPIIHSHQSKLHVGTEFFIYIFSSTGSYPIQGSSAIIGGITLSASSISIWLYYFSTCKNMVVTGNQGNLPVLLSVDRCVFSGFTTNVVKLL
jgi:hypothetical protein